MKWEVELALLAPASPWKPVASSKLRMGRLSTGHQEGVGWGMCSQPLDLLVPCSPLVGDNGAMIQTSGLDSVGGSQC